MYYCGRVKKLPDVEIKVGGDNERINERKKEGGKAKNTLSTKKVGKVI